MPRVNVVNGKVEGYLTVTEAAKKLKTSPAILRKKIYKGEIPVIKLYRIYLIKERDLKKRK